ncbi:hypothetical protein M3Y95_01245600 [Aphelenchoides besseyi]|nr:hypothetical protein M3Y95_01245600 [Aphelenchoides besseyi]
MGLYQLIFEHDEFLRLYNCSFYQVDSIPIEKRKHFGFGLLILILGVFYELLYVPCVYALSRKHVRESSFCYEVMLLMTLFDMLTIPLTCLLPGWFSMQGLMFCSAPYTSYLAGTALLASWVPYTSASIILTLNRCLLFTSYSHIFSGRKRLLWLAFPVICALLIFIFANPGLYNPIYGAFFFNPHLGFFEDSSGKYNSQIQLWNNVVFIVVQPTIYFLFLTRYLAARSIQIPKREKALFIQAFIVNVTIVSAALGYTLMQWIKLPVEFIAFSHISWVVIEGTPSLIYLLYNQSVRRVLLVDTQWIRRLRMRVGVKAHDLLSTQNAVTKNQSVYVLQNH